jgi:anti-sigma B factor antagonist
MIRPEKGDMAERRFFVRGEIDLANAPALHEEMYEALCDNHDDLAVDCCGLTFIDSTGIAVLYATAETLHAEGRSFRIVNADHLAERIFQLSGLTEILHVNDDRAAS